MTKKVYFWACFWPVWPKFGSSKNFSWVLCLADVRHCCKLPSYAISNKNSWPKLKRMAKNPHFESDLGLVGSNLGHQFFLFFFSKIWFHQSLDIIANYHHVQYQKKPIIKPRKNLVMDRWTDRRVISYDTVWLMLRVQKKKISNWKLIRFLLN